jgi:hypothetical protein
MQARGEVGWECALLLGLGWNDRTQRRYRGWIRVVGQRTEGAVAIVLAALRSREVAP